MKQPWTVGSDGVRLTVRVSPRSQRSEVTGIAAISAGDTALAIRLAALPVDGAANDALCRYLAKLLKLPASTVTIRSGASARIKQIDLTGDPAAIADRLAELAS